MKKWMSLITLMIMFCFTADAGTINGVKAELNFDENYKSTAIKFGSQYLTFVPERVSFPSRSKLGKAQKKKFDKALEIMEEVMNSEDFKQMVLSYKRVVGHDGKGNPVYERSYQKNFLWKDPSKRLTNEDVYDILMNGDERMAPDSEGEMNYNSYVKICPWWEKIRTWCRHVVGSTSPYKSKMITLNWKFYRKSETHEMVSNMVHEWIHLLGFLHGKKNMRQEVPYVVGAIAGQVAKKILEKQQE